MKLHGPGSRINHPKFGKGVITNLTAYHYFVSFIDTGIETIDLDSEFEVIESLSFDLDLVSFSEVEKSLKELLERWSDIGPLVKIGERWKGGRVEIHPGDDTQSKEIPIDTFFHKIVMIRDRIRVMEQKINANKEMDNNLKIDLQQYITRIYGSLTTFNVLFKYKEDSFVGERSK